MRPLDIRLVRATTKGRTGALLTLVLGVARTGLAVGQAVLLARVLAAGFTGAGLDAVRGSVGALAAVLLGRGVAAGLQDAVSRGTCAAVKQELRRIVLKRVTDQGPQWLSSRRSGELATLLGTGIESLDGYFRLYLPLLLLSVLMPSAVVFVLVAADWRSAAVVGLTLPLLPLFLALVGMHTRSQTAHQWRELSRLGGHFLDVVTGLPTLRVFGRAQAQVAVLRRITTEHRLATMATLRTAFLSALVLELVATLSVAVLAVSVGFRLLAGGLDLRTALLVLLLAPEAYLPLRAVGAAFHAAMAGVTVAASAFAILDEPLPQRHQGRRGPTTVRLHLAGVRVHHDGRDDPVLEVLDLRVAVGEHVALLGPSGAGKSALLAVVLGLVTPTQGRMLVGGTDLRELNLARWRECIAWVPQAPHLFAQSIADNIRLARPDASEREVLAAARAAQVDEFAADLPNGLRTVLGERGHGLSVGEQRRVAVARAFLRDAPLVVLDEPTAGLDTYSEAAVAAALERLGAGRTVLLATHRTAILTPSYRQVQLFAGRVVADTDVPVRR